MVCKWTVVVFLGVRVASVPLVQTWFVPDEYWQATEVAHAMAFKYGYRTWEWREGIRGVLYPASLATVFGFLSFLGADTPTLLIHIPRLLHAVAFAVGDYHIWKLTKAVYGSGAAGWTVVCLSTAWFLQYCAPRTLTSCVETVLLAIAFSYYPWCKERESGSAGYLWPVGLACAVRPTAAVPFLPLVVRHLWYSSCRTRLLLHYIIITAAVMGLTVGLDSWYYGELAVVPWRFLHFNVVTGLSSHYGTLPWHWYVSQGLPATLTTHLLPLVLALVSQPSRHSDLMPVILWSLLVYSCLGHKEFRFLLPVLPLCLCVAGDYIAFHLAAHAKKSGRRTELRRTVIFLVLLIPNVVAVVYLGLIHQRGPLDTMQALREETDANPQADILFLMPCHSTPYYSHLHRNVTMRFLTCEPNLKGEEHYLDEADVFERDPLTWLQQEYGSEPPAFPESLLTSPEKGMDKGEKNGKSKKVVDEMDREMENTERIEASTAQRITRNFREGERKNTAGDGMESRIERILDSRFVEGEAQEDMGMDGSIIIRGDITAESNRNEGRETDFQVEIDRKKYMRNINSRAEREMQVGVREDGNPRDITAHSSNLPSHIVMFSILKDKLEQFLNDHHYYLCHKLFHSHTNDGRRSQHIHIYCR